jgi:hypothetical protein
MYKRAAFVSILYLILITLLVNSGLTKDTLVGNYGLDYKVRILVSLIQGMWTSMSPFGFLTLLIVALLTGANFVLLFEKITVIKRFDKLQFVVGGNSLLGIVGGGCIACGLPVISLLGFSGSLMYLPYRGAELPYVSILLLSISFYMLIKSRNQLCTVNYEKYE